MKHHPRHAGTPASPEGQDDRKSLTLGALLSSLEVGQIWGTAVALVALISGAFALGTAVSSRTHENEVSELKRRSGDLESQFAQQNSDLKAERTRFRGIETKERIMSLYCRYFLAKESADAETTKQALAALDNAVMDAWDKFHRTPAEAAVEVTGIVVGKGRTARDVTIRFVYDNSAWNLPKEVTRVGVAD